MTYALVFAGGFAGGVICAMLVMLDILFSKTAACPLGKAPYNACTCGSVARDDYALQCPPEWKP